jgi:hypothetical protein
MIADAVAVLYRLVRWLLGLAVVLVRRDLSKDAELLVLRHENACGARIWGCGFDLRVYER